MLLWGRKARLGAGVWEKETLQSVQHMSAAGKILRKRAGKKPTSRGGGRKLSKGQLGQDGLRPVVTDRKWTFCGS